METEISKDIFISYSRRDQEFVTRLAADLNARVSGVWFDQASIQLGQRWHDEIMEGIRECKAFILVLSPDAVESRYVREEVNKALELGKTIFPVIYRPAQWTGEFASLVSDVQTLDMRAGSYMDNFQKLVDGLIEAGAGKASGERPFLRAPASAGLGLVLGKVPGWALAWSLGWVIFSAVLVTFLLIVTAIIASQDSSIRVGTNDALDILIMLLSAGMGGFAGGLLAGLFTMLALRPNAPSISWKHMSPTIRIWGISGALGIAVSALMTSVMIGIGVLTVSSAETSCEGLGLGECLGASFGNALGEAIATVFLILAVFLLFVTIAWFLTGMFAGWQVVRHIRRLEPGITSGQGWRVSAGWGCGAILAAVVTVVLIGILSSVSGA